MTADEQLRCTNNMEMDKRRDGTVVQKCSERVIDLSHGGARPQRASVHADRHQTVQWTGAVAPGAAMQTAWRTAALAASCASGLRPRSTRTHSNLRPEGSDGEGAVQNRVHVGAVAAPTIFAISADVRIVPGDKDGGKCPIIHPITYWATTTITLWKRLRSTITPKRHDGR